MKHLILLMLPIFLIGCETYEPLIDLKASEDDKAKHAQEDHMECEWLINRYVQGWFIDENESDKKMLTRTRTLCSQLILSTDVTRLYNQ